MQGGSCARPRRYGSAHNTDVTRLGPITAFGSGPANPASGAAREERDPRPVALGQLLVRDPDLLDHPATNLEHRRRGSVRRQIPEVLADMERTRQLQPLLGRGDGRVT